MDNLLGSLLKGAVGTQDTEQIIYRGRTIQFKSKQRFHSLDEPLKTDVQAWDIGSGLSVTSTHPSKEGAIKEAQDKLVKLLQENGHHLDVDKSMPRRRNAENTIPAQTVSSPIGLAAQQQPGPNTTLKYADLQIHELIGRGGYAEVYRVTFKRGSFRGHHQGAAKKLNRLSESEVRILRKVQHRNIITFLDYVQEGLTTCIVLELADESLRKHLDRQRDRIPESLKIKWVNESSEAIRYLHNGIANGNGARMSIIHRDIKAANCLLFGDLLKVSDFGIARETDHTTATLSRKGTEPWMAPEVLEASKFSAASDIYALGVLYWEIYTQEIPQAHRDGNGNRQWGQPLSSIRHHFPSHLESLLPFCWFHYYKDRPTIDVVIATLSQDSSSSSSSTDSYVDLK